MLLPVLFIVGYIIFEMVGMTVNYYATKHQTRELERAVRKSIDDADMVDSYSETGNTSGTGNHVDMLSVVVFKTDKGKGDVEKFVKTSYPDIDEWGFYVEAIESMEKNKRENEWVPMYYEQLTLPEDKTDCYLVYLCTPAPFEDNIEGH